MCGPTWQRSARIRRSVRSSARRWKPTCRNTSVRRIRRTIMNMGRREFLGSALGVAAATNVNAEANAKSYSEKTETPIVAGYQVVVAGGGPGGVIAAGGAE